MAEASEPKMQATLGLTGLILTVALIAPGAFLWITFVVQAGYSYPSGNAMWFGILAALALAFATAISYAELNKLYPGAGSSYLFAEQAFLNHSRHYRFARIAKFVLGWGSHLYYWVYPGAMAATIGIMIGYIVGIFFPNTINSGTPGPVFMALVAIIAAFGISYIAYRGVQASTWTNFTINVVQIIALMIFALMAIVYRIGHPEGSTGLALDGTSKVLHYSLSGNAPAHPTGWSVVAPHGFNNVMLQATIAIFLLCGFESITSLGEEAKNPKKDISRGVLLSLFIQGLICYMTEYFAANYFLSSAYSLNDAKGSAAPIGDMMTIVGNALLGGHGQAFMVVEAVTVFLALIGTTLACMNTGARVTYAMGRDEEVPEHFPVFCTGRASPHIRIIWTLAVVSAVFGVIGALYYFAGGSAPDDKTIATLPHNIWYAAGMSSNAYLAGTCFNGLALVTLVSNFGIPNFSMV